MTCRDGKHSTADVLVDYCAGTLDAAAIAEMEAHLAACVACDELVRAQLSALSVLDEWHAPKVSEDFDAHLYRRIEATKRDGWAARLWNSITGFGLSPIWKPAIPLGAATLAVTVGLLLHTPSTPLLSSVPAPSVEPGTTTAQIVDADQLEKALDDLDMLTPIARKGAL